MPIRILLADDHELFCQAIQALFKDKPAFEWVGEAENGRAAVEKIRALEPDVVIMDIGLPDLNGMEATRQILAERPRTRVVALSMYGDARFVIGMLHAGASAYVLKDSKFDHLEEAIRNVMKGRMYLDPAITGAVIRNLVQDPSSQSISILSILSDREREVLQLVAEGRTTKVIAAELHVSVKTIETYRKKIMDKLGLHSIAELTKYAIREGLTTLE